MFRAVLLAFVLFAASAAGATAQSTDNRADTASPSPHSDSAAVDTAAARDEPDRVGGECFRFMFGEWTPPLDAKAAGHAPFPSAESLQHAPGGRDWAFNDSSAHDLQLMLYPGFWPAGVRVRFPHAPRTPSDTVRGRALALVADGRVRSPEADAMAWLVPCAR